MANKINYKNPSFHNCAITSYYGQREKIFEIHSSRDYHVIVLCLSFGSFYFYFFLTVQLVAKVLLLLGYYLLFSLYTGMCYINLCTVFIHFIISLIHHLFNKHLENFIKFCAFLSIIFSIS